MLKNLSKLNGASPLNKNEQKSIKGGNPILIVEGPCGPTGGKVVPSGYCSTNTYGTIYYNGVCWACY